MFQTKDITYYLKKYQKEDSYICADLTFYLALNKAILPLLNGKNLLLTEELVMELKNWNHPKISELHHQSLFSILDSLSITAHLHIIPKTIKRADLDMYCHRIGLNYQDPSDILLAYYKKWGTVEGKDIILFTKNIEMYKKAKMIKIRTILIK